MLISGAIFVHCQETEPYELSNMDAADYERQFNNQERVLKRRISESQLGWTADEPKIDQSGSSFLLEYLMIAHVVQIYLFKYFVNN